MKIPGRVLLYWKVERVDWGKSLSVRGFQSRLTVPGCLQRCAVVAARMGRALVGVPADFVPYEKGLSMGGHTVPITASGVLG